MPITSKALNDVCKDFLDNLPAFNNRINEVMAMRVNCPNCRSDQNQIIDWSLENYDTQWKCRRCKQEYKIYGQLHKLEEGGWWSI